MTPNKTCEEFKLSLEASTKEQLMESIATFYISVYNELSFEDTNSFTDIINASNVTLLNRLNLMVNGQSLLGRNIEGVINGKVSLRERVNNRLTLELLQQKAEGKRFISDDEVDSLIDDIIKDEMKN